MISRRYGILPSDMLKSCDLLDFNFNDLVAKAGLYYEIEAAKKRGQAGG